MKLLEVKKLTVSFGGKEVVKGIDFTLNKGETLALVGESGSGKTVSALSLTKLLPEAQVSGKVLLQKENLLIIPEEKLQKIRGVRIGYIFQEPMSSLNPLHTIEKQVAETLLVHGKVGHEQARTRAIELLKLVGFSGAEERLGAYPHQLSGGQRQRVMIAQALANKPDIIVADEPTTALDVTIQKQIIDLLDTLKKQLDLSILFITHDLGIVNSFADRIAVMKDGLIVETGGKKGIMEKPSHPYTRELIANYNMPPKEISMNDNSYVLEAKDVSVSFPLSKNKVLRAVNSISFTLKQGSALGIVGESGSGKTTLAMAFLRLVKSEGEIFFNGVRIDGLSTSELRPYRKDLQVVFQDPYASLNPRMSISQILKEGLDVHYSYLTEEQKIQEITNTLKLVGMDGEKDKDKYPHEFSGGQRQRISIARAIILKPQLLILDEPSSSLDMSLRSQIISLLKDLQNQNGMSYIFISHDMNSIRAICDEIIVMKDGKMVEKGKNKDIFSTPKESYTKKLIESSFSFNL